MWLLLQDQSRLINLDTITSIRLSEDGSEYVIWYYEIGNDDPYEDRYDNEAEAKRRFGNLSVWTGSIKQIL